MRLRSVVACASLVAGALNNAAGAYAQFTMTAGGLPRRLGLLTQSNSPC